MKKILIFLGNPEVDSFTGRLAEAYELGAKATEMEVERVNLSEMKFDPILHHGYKEIQKLEPDLVLLQEKISWADHLVFIYPNWWCSMPAGMKGVFDRIWLPGFAFNFDPKTKAVMQLLKGKTARVIIVGGTHSPLMTWLKYGDYTNEISNGILGFSGIKVQVTAFGPSERVSEKTLLKWVDTVADMGVKGK